LSQDKSVKPVQIGALAIPLANYGNEDGFSSDLLPEFSRTGAFYSAALIALNAALILEHSYESVPLQTEKSATIRDAASLKELTSKYGNVPESEIHEYQISMLKEDLQNGLDNLNFLRNWVESEGKDLISKYL
jgi:hypothetical protein